MNFWINDPDYTDDIDDDAEINVPESIFEFLKKLKPHYPITLPEKPEDWVDLAHFFGVRDHSMDEFFIDFKEVEKDVAKFLQIWLEKKGDIYAASALALFNRHSRLADNRKGQAVRIRVSDDDLSATEYLLFRREFPGRDRNLNLDSRKHIETVEQISQELAGFGIDKNLVFRALDADFFNRIPWGIDRACDELSLLLIEDAARRETLISSGASHLVGRKKVIPESIINETALLILGRCHDDGISPPYSLIVLLRLQLDRLSPLNLLKADSSAFDLAALMLASNPSYTNRAIGRAVGVDQSTVGRWRKRGDFRKKIEGLSRISNIEVLGREFAHKKE